MEQYRWLPLTKVRIPTTQHTLQRNTLTGEVVSAISTKRLTLIAAPAGSGKTTLAAMALQTITPAHVAWLSLDREDNDPTTFLIGIIAALQTVAPSLGQTVLEDMEIRAATNSDFVQWIGRLVNDLLEWGDSPLILVLDDLHLITDAVICAGLNYLLERMPPHLHLMATSRYDPPLALARVRAQGQLAEFRLGQLLFKPSETTQLLNEQLALVLSPTDIDHIQERSEGWIAGVRLLALSLSEIPAARRSEFLARLTQEDQYVFDLLAEEVLAQQPSKVREFLLATAILRELTPDLCRHVTQREDAADLLKHLYRSNLFLMAVEGENHTRTYRYHALFHDFLRQRLERESPDFVQRLHLRAATYVEPPRAFYHYVQAQAWEDAATLLSTLGQDALWQGRYGILQEWLESIPSTIRQQYPWLLFLEGFLYYHKGDMPHAYQLLQAALKKFEANGDKNGEWETIGALVGNVLQAFNPEGQHYYIDLCLRLLKNPIAAPLRGRTLMGLAWWSTLSGDWEAVPRYLEEAMTLCRADKDLKMYGAVIPHLSAPLFSIPTMRFQITRFFNEFLEKFGEQTLLGVWAHEMLFTAAFVEGKWQQVRQEKMVTQAALVRTNVTFYWNLNWLLFNLFLAYAEGDQPALIKTETELLELMQLPMGYSVIFSGLALQAYRAWLYRDDRVLQQARAEVERLRAAGYQQDLTGRVGDKLVDAIAALMARRYQEAEPILRAIITEQEQHPISLFNSPDARVLLAHLYLTQRQREAASGVVHSLFRYYEEREEPGMLLRHGDALLPLFELAENSASLRPFVTEIHQLWGELREGRTVVLPYNEETLTPREVEVLELLCQGASNRDIAEQLVVTERTVKSHVTNILSKMGVVSRGQAVARARELNLF